MAADKLSEAAKTFVVQSLAMYDPPSAVAKAVRTEYDVVITPQSIEAYDPTKRAGARIADKWKTIFEETRKTFLEDASKIAVSHRAVRLRALQRMAARAEETGNLALAAQLLEQIAKEMGDAFTNRRVVSAPGGGAPFQIINQTMSPKEAAEAYADMMRGDG